MTLLSNLVCEVIKLPDAELKPGVAQAERPNEMALMAKIIPPNEIDEWKKNGVDIRRACFNRRDNPRVEFRVINGSLHTVVASYNSMNGLIVTDNGEALSITTVDEFSSYIRSLAEKDTT